MTKIVFICTANQFRSPIAAAYFSTKLQNEHIPGDWDVISAGTWTKNGLPAHPSAIKLGEKFQLDISSHKTREVNSEILIGADLVLVMEQGHKEALCFEFPLCCEKIFLLSQVTDKNAVEITDPANNEFHDAQQIVQVIIDTIDNVFLAIIALTKSRAEVNHDAQQSS